MHGRTPRVLVTAAAAGMLVAAAQAPAGAATSWSVVSTANRSTISNYLNDVAVLSPSSAWAVGSAYDINLASPRTLVQRWNGTAWSAVSTPNATSFYNELSAVDAASANDVWAVGYAGGSSGVNGSPRNQLALHWNGSAWSISNLPQPGVANRELYDVRALSASDVWAVGWYYETGFVAENLVMHWNGTSWAQVSVPNPGNSVNQLYGIGGSGPNDLWAVGNARNTGEPRGTLHAVALHYNGSGWTSVPVPDAPSGSAILRSVTVLSPTDAWAVGSQHGYAAPVAYHWNGTAWSLVPTPALAGGGNNLLYRVAALDSSRVWAVGYTTSGGGSGPQPLVERWNGSTWALETVPTQTFGGMANGVAAVAGTNGTSSVWLTGSRTDYVNGNFSDRTLAIRGIG